MAESDPTFTPRSFVEGAKMAYEMIVDGFAKGDKAALKNLLSKEVFDGFARAIDDAAGAGPAGRIPLRRHRQGHHPVRPASLGGKKATITMEFVSEMISATYDKAGQVIDGDPKEIREVTDVWTFERDVDARAIPTGSSWPPRPRPEPQAAPHVIRRSGGLPAGANPFADLAGWQTP